MQLQRAAGAANGASSRTSARVQRTGVRCRAVVAPQGGRGAAASSSTHARAPTVGAARAGAAGCRHTASSCRACGPAAAASPDHSLPRRAAAAATHTTPGAEASKRELLQYDGPLSEVDPDIANIIRNEKARQVRPCCTQPAQQQPAAGLQRPARAAPSRLRPCSTAAASRLRGTPATHRHAPPPCGRAAAAAAITVAHHTRRCTAWS